MNGRRYAFMMLVFAAAAIALSAQPNAPATHATATAQATATVRVISGMRLRLDGQNNSSDAAQQQQVQQQLEQADVTANQAQRLQLYNQAEQQLVNDVAWLPIFQESTARLVKTYVIGRVFNGDGLVPPDDWVNVYITVH